MNHNQSTTVLILPLFFLLMLFVIPNLIALMSGWKLLAQRFRLQGEFFGQKWSWQSAQMRYRANYNNCLNVGADQTGLFIQPMIFFRLAHPPLFVPWNEITWSTTQVLWLTMTELRLGRTEQVPFRIRASLAARIRAATGPSWAAQSST